MNAARRILPPLVLALLVPSIAHAADASAAGMFSIPPTTDLWRHLLETIFPGVGPLAGSATQGTSALAAAMSAFVTALMPIACAMLAWHVIAGMVATAQEGTVLGKSWHTIWSPVRIVLGVGMLAPVAGGFCLAQVLVLTIACWSGSLGNILWDAYLSGLTSPTLTAPALPATGAAVKSFAEATGCYAAVNERRAELGLAAMPAVSPAQSNLSSAGGLAVTAGNAWSYLTSWTTGGSQTSSGAVNRTLVTWSYGPCGSIGMPLALNSGGDATVTAFDQARLRAFTALASSLSSSATAFVSAATSPAATPASTSSATAAATSAISNAKASLDSFLTSAAAGLVAEGNNASLSSFTSAAQSAGWVSAGLYYPTLARLQTRVQQLADTLPELTVSGVADDADAQSASVIRELRTPNVGTLWQWSSAYDSASAGWSSTTPDLSAGVRAGSDSASAVSVSGVLSWLFSGVFSVTDSYVTGVSASPDAGAPLQQMAVFGSKLLSALTSLFTIGIVALLAGGGGFIGAALGATGLLAYVVKIAVAVGGGLLLVGVTHAYVLPMLPFVSMLFAVVGMLVLVCEAMVAAPLWALAHVRMDGQELVDGPQRAGYQLLFNLLLRIPATMCGLFLSLQVFSAGIWLLDDTFYPAMLSATADTSSGIVGAVVMLLLISYLHWQLAIRSFSLITALPDRVSRWLGAPADGGDAERPAGDVRALVVGGVQSAARQAAPERGHGGAPAPGGPAGRVVGVKGGERGGIAPAARAERDSLQDEPGPSGTQ